MKLSALFAILAIGSVQVTYGQDEDVLRPKGRPTTLGQSPGRTQSSSSPVTIGFEGGINLSFFSQDITGALATSPVQTFGSGSGVAPYASLFVDVGITPTIGVQLRAAYDRKMYGNTGDAIIDCTIFDEYGQIINITTTPVSVDYTSALTYITLSPQFRWEPIPHFIVLAGPSVQFRASSLVTESTQSIPNDNECFFPGPNGEQLNSRTIADTADTSAILNSVRFGAEISVAYRIPLTKSIDLVPRVGYQFMFTPVGSAGDPFVDQSRSLTLGPTTVTAGEPSLHSLQAVLGLWIRL
jgi:Outer membrane protein beta-barrel domain